MADFYMYRVVQEFVDGKRHTWITAQNPADVRQQIAESEYADRPIISIKRGLYSHTEEE